MDEKRNTCQMLMEEYELLKEKVEAVELAPNLKPENLADLGISVGDLSRLKELELELEKNCGEYFAKFDRVDFGPGIDNGLFSEENQ